ncbi:MAG: hypothetical protein NC293_12570 [Roseburia sp.]|nr:hypothetical protein [Roseburia sp.]
MKDNDILSLSLLELLKIPWVWIVILTVVLLFGVVGFFIGRAKRGKRIKLEDIILAASFLGAFACFGLALVGKTEISLQILNFYLSFVFSWLLTKKSSQNEFLKMQHKVAKNTYRHIEDVETTVLITIQRMNDLIERIKDDTVPDITQGDLDGVMDDLYSILTGIRSNKDDWKDMLKKSYREKIKSQEDPEGRLEKLNERKKPTQKEFKKEFEDDIKSQNNE